MKTYTLEELRLAQAKKCRIEILVDGVWMELKNPEFKEPDDVCRIHPADEWKARLPRLREGAEWHRNDFTNDLLGGGYRPLILKENGEGQQLVLGLGWMDFKGIDCPIRATHAHCRTTRPVPPEFLHPDELTKQPESAQAHDFGEPWKLVGEYIFNKHSNFVGDKARIISCVNALSGVPDPAEFVRQARNTVKELVDLCERAKGIVQAKHPNDADIDDFITDFEAVIASAKLQPFLP